MSGLTLYTQNGRVPLALDALLAKVGEARARRGLPFDEKRMALAAELSDRLNREKRFAASAALRAFGFWTRKSALARLREQFVARLPQQTLAVGRGIAFHLPPTNVDTLFLYSWVVAFLTGNVNVTRLPSAFAGPSAAALNHLLPLIEAGGFADSFVFYPADENINTALSRAADLRLVWGGDAKAAAFSVLPQRLGGRTLVFPDRYSYAVVDGAFLQELDAPGHAALAEGMCNDIFVFNQMACSSPHILYVVGAAAQHAEAVRSFLVSIDSVAQAKGFACEPAHALEKFASAAHMAGCGDVSRMSRFSNNLTTVELTAPLTPSPGGGFLSVAYLPSLAALAARVHEHHQTLTYAGFSPEHMATFARTAAPHGLRRIVPVGRALEFDALWDGQDMLAETVTFVKVG